MHVSLFVDLDNRHGLIKSVRPESKMREMIIIEWPKRKGSTRKLALSFKRQNRQKTI